MEIAGSKIAAVEWFVYNHPGVAPYPFTSPADRRSVLLQFEMTKPAAASQALHTNGLHEPLQCTAAKFNRYSVDKVKGMHKNDISIVSTLLLLLLLPLLLLLLLYYY
jgi:hypothetical protein